MGPTRILSWGATHRRAALVALLASVASLLPAPGLAQGAGAAPGTPAGPVPRLGAHRFATTTLVHGPFIRTSWRNQLGVGGSGGFTLGTVAVGDTTISIESGELLYTALRFEYQQAVKDWLGFSLLLGGSGRLGTETSSLLAEGVSVATVFDVGWLARFWQTEEMMLCGGLHVDSRNYTIVDLVGFVDQIIEDGGLQPGNTLVRSVPLLTTMSELRYAYGVNDLVGVVARAQLGYGESVSREASSQWYHVLGAAVDVDLNPRTSVPVGLALGLQLYNVPLGDPDLDGNGTAIVVRLSHTGTPDLNLGLDIESRWLRLAQVEGTVRYTNVTLDFEYFF